MYITTPDKLGDTAGIPFGTDAERKALKNYPDLVIADYRQADQSVLREVLASIEQRQFYVEVTSDGVTFVNNLMAPTQTVQVTPRSTELRTSEAVGIIMSSPMHFGLPNELSRYIRGKLDRGTVFRGSDNGVQVFTCSFEQLRRDGAVSSDTGDGGD